MPAHSHRVGALVLAREEIRALPRPAFALGAVAVVLLAVAPLAAFGLYGESAFRDLLMFMWVVGELVVAIVLAARVASARRTRFVESLYTTPLRPSDWLLAQACVGAFLAALVLLAQVPFLLVQLVLVGVPPSLSAILLAALGMAAFSVVLGIFCGVIVGESGPGAAAGLAGGIAFASFFALIVHGIFAGGPPTPAQPFILRLTALSPLVLAVDASGIDIFDAAPEAWWRPALGLAALVGGLAGAAWLAYTRGQGPLGWEPRRARLPVALLVALAVVAPVAAAETSYREVGDEPSFVLSHGEHTRVSFVPRGAPVADEHFTLRSPFEWEALKVGQENEMDLLVMLLVPEGSAVRNVHVRFDGGDDLRVVAGGSFVVADGAPAGHARTSDTFDDDAPASGPSRPVYRVPLVLEPLEARALLGSPNFATIETTFMVAGSALESQAQVTLEAEVPGVSLVLLAAGAPFPLAALGALVVRRVKTR